MNRLVYPALMGPDDPGAQDRCSTCEHARWRHHHGVCTEYASCACNGWFDESGYLIPLKNLG